MRAPILLFLSLAFGLCLTEVRAQEFGVDNSRFGLGLILGEPLGPSAKYFFSRRSAVDVGVTYSFEEFFLIYSNYLFHFPWAFKNQVPELTPLTPYVGVGAGARIASEGKPDEGDAKAYLFSRIPLGVEWIFDRPAIGLGLEIAPGISLAPDVSFLMQGGLTARYYF